MGHSSHLGVGIKTLPPLKVALHHYNKLQFGQRVTPLHKVPKIVVLVDFHPILKEQWIVCVGHDVVLRLKTTLCKICQNCSCSLRFRGLGRKRSHPYLSVLFGGTDHNLYIHAPLAQNFNGHAMEILMCQQPPTHELQGDVHLVGVENSDKE